MVSYLTPLPLFEEFARSVHYQCCYTLLQLRYFPVSLIRIKEIQIGDHEDKIVNVADDITIFLRDINCLNWIQVILELYEDGSISKLNFLKTKDYGLEHIKKRIDQPGQMQWSQFSIKILGVNFSNSTLDCSNWTK